VVAGAPQGSEGSEAQCTVMRAGYMSDRVALLGAILVLHTLVIVSMYACLCVVGCV